MASGAVPRTERDFGYESGPHCRGSKKKLWEHEPASVADAPDKGNASRLASGGNRTETIAGAPDRAATQSAHGKGKKKPAKNDPQIDLF